MAHGGRFYEHLPSNSIDKNWPLSTITERTSSEIDVPDEPTADSKTYKPFVLRAPFQCLFLFLILLYIALLEVAGHHYPRYDASLIPVQPPSTSTPGGLMVTTTITNAQPSMIARQATATTSEASQSAPTTSAPSATTSTAESSATSTDAPVTQTTTAPSQDTQPAPVVQETSTGSSKVSNPQPTTAAPPPSTAAPPPSAAAPPPTAAAPPPSAAAPPPSAAAPPPSAAAPPSSAAAPPPSAAAPPPSVASSDASVPENTAQSADEPAPSQTTNPSSATSANSAPTFSAPSSAFVQTNPETPTDSAVSSENSSGTTNAPATAHSTTTTTTLVPPPSGDATTDTAAPTQITPSNSGSSGENSSSGTVTQPSAPGASDESSTGTSVSEQPLPSNFLPTSLSSPPEPTATNQPLPGGGNFNGSSDGDNTHTAFPGPLVSVQDVPDTRTNISKQDYFVGSYLMVLAAILLRILFSQIYNNMRMMEPFHQLAQKDGVLGKHVMQDLYLSSSFTPEIVRSTRAKRWLMALVSATGILLDIFVSVASETFIVDDRHCHVSRTNDPNHPCFPRVTIRIEAFRIAEVMLALLFAGSFVAAVFNWKRKSAVFSNPSSIAYMTSLLHHPDVLDQFRQLDPAASSSEIRDTLSNDRFKLEYYYSRDGALRYGIVPMANDRCFTPESDASFEKDLQKQDIVQRSGSKAKEVTVRFWGDVCLLLVIVIVLGLVGAYWADGKKDDYNGFMNDGGFGPRFVFTMIGTVIVTLWTRTDHETRTQAPYRQLLKPTSAKPILAVSQSSPWTAFPKALVTGSFFVAVVAFNVMLSELLTVALSGVPYSASNYWVGYVISTWLSISVLIVMGVTGLLVVRRRAFGPRFPRSPETLANVWSYVATSRMRADFQDLSTLSREDLSRRVRSWEKSYVFGMQQGADGRKRFLVDAQLE